MAMRAGPIVIGYDGTNDSERALRDGGSLLKPWAAVVVVVWKQGLGFEYLELPSTVGLPPAAIDIRTALEIDKKLYERAQRLAQHGARLAREVGLAAEALAVAEDLETPISETLVSVAKQRDSRAMVVGGHGHGGLLGATVRGVIREAPCPVVVTGPAEHGAS
jgi:nucleotide-binding universal stress UspA family protein